MLDFLHGALREIFQETLRKIDAGDAVRRAVGLEASTLQILDSTFNIDDRPVYAIALGKAARPMVSALVAILGERLAGCVISAPVAHNTETDPILPNQCRLFSGGHPLPNRESLDAARAAFDLLRKADHERALVIFLISGGGSAMFELPRDESVSLEELRTMNEVLVSCGAGIEEINVVRRAVSAVKGGGLAAQAPNCDQISLIVSDTSTGAESSVASGPTFDHLISGPDPCAVISRYDLQDRLPQSILRLFDQLPPQRASSTSTMRREHHVLLENGDALNAAADAARSRGFIAEITVDVHDQPIAEGCARLLARLLDLRGRAGSDGKIVCVISGGEFACPVRGNGTGGRNAETALRWAMEMHAIRSARSNDLHLVALSAGTDGIDGNSPAAGGVVDELTVARAHELDLDARGFLEASDAYSLLNALGDTIVTGPTGTNVRDVRILLAG